MWSTRPSAPARRAASAARQAAVYSATLLVQTPKAFPPSWSRCPAGVVSSQPAAPGPGGLLAEHPQ
jgi:hypothetical protein